MQADQTKAGPQGSRWRVVLVRLPPRGWRAIKDALPHGRRVTQEDLPLVTRVSGDLAVARLTAERLRAAGSQVVIIEEPADPRSTAFCASHPALIAPMACERCGASICSHCMVLAEGRALCDRDRQDRDDLRQVVRTRQLFSVFLFSVFLYQVWLMVRDDQVRVSPLGPVDIGIVQFIDADDSGAWIVGALNGEAPEGYQGPGLRDIGAWFDKEHQRYTGSKREYARIHLHGPWSVAVEPPNLADPEANWFEMAFKAVQYPTYFRRLAQDFGVDPRQYGVKAYVVYTDDDSMDASHSVGAEKGRFAVAFVSLTERNAAYALATVAHEIAHTLGAIDLYDPNTYLPVHPEGYVEPFKEPLYPQRYAEIMAVDLPIGMGLEAEIREMDQLRIGHQTASDMGWITPEQAHRVYYPGTDPELGLE